MLFLIPVIMLATTAVAHAQVAPVNLTDSINAVRDAASGCLMPVLKRRGGETVIHFAFGSEGNFVSAKMRDRGKPVVDAAQAADIAKAMEGCKIPPLALADGKRRTLPIRFSIPEVEEMLPEVNATPETTRKVDPVAEAIKRELSKDALTQSKPSTSPDRSAQQQHEIPLPVPRVEKNRPEVSEKLLVPDDKAKSKLMSDYGLSLRTLITQCWNALPGAKAVTVHVNIDASGKLTVPPLPVAGHTDAPGQMSAAAATRAILRCAPYPARPAELKDDSWNRIEIVFDSTTAP